MPWRRIEKRSGRRLAFLLAALSVLVAALGCASTARGGGPTTPTSCLAPFTIGYQVIPLHDGRSMAVWYPSDGAQTTYYYATDTSATLARNGRTLSGCGAFPLVIFSHGLGGCGTQSLFLTETLARQGYVVAAPDHAAEGDMAPAQVEGTRKNRRRSPQAAEPARQTRLAPLIVAAAPCSGRAFQNPPRERWVPPLPRRVLIGGPYRWKRMARSGTPGRGGRCTAWSTRPCHPMVLGSYAGTTATDDWSAPARAIP